MLPALVLAQSIAVVATPALRPTPVILANVRYAVAVDSTLGGLVIRDLTLPPVSFAGAIRIEAAEPYARAGLTRVYPDTVRFEPDGRVLLRLANGERPPFDVEVEGGATAPGGRIRVTAPGWPLNRVFLVTIRPADIHEHVWREAGWGERDRVRVDDRRGIAVLTDSAIARTSVAIVLGPGARGRIQTDATEIVVTRRYGPDLAEERRTVGALTLVLEPERDELATARAEIRFGLGATEEEAVRAAEAAAGRVQGRAPAPLLRVTTPEPAVGQLLAHLLAGAWPTLDARWIPASLDAPYPMGPAGAAAIPLAVQAGRAAAVCAEYQRFREVAGADGTQRVAVATRLGPRGAYRWVLEDDSVEGRARESAQLLKGHACYRATRDSTWLFAELPRLRAAARLPGAGGSDPMRAEAVARLAELEDETARLLGQSRVSAAGDSLRDLAARLRGGPPRQGAGLWRDVADQAARVLARRYGRLGAAEAGRFLERVVRELFGVDERLDAIAVAPRLDGAFDDFSWRIEGVRVHDDTLALAYRPASREATIRLRALRPRRLALRFPWLTPSSCVTARRGRETERLPLVFTVAGEAWVDLRGAFQPAEVTVRATCESGGGGS